MNEVWRLQAEIRRLQAILDDNDIDYEPEQFGPPDRPEMGPPTQFEHLMHLQIKNMAKRFAEWAPNIYGGKYPETANPLRMRLPIDFTVKL